MGRVVKVPEQVAMVNNLVSERVFLFLESTRNNILPKALELLENLSVVAVHNIERQLHMVRNKHHSSSRFAKANITACVEVKEKKSILYATLYFVPDKLEWFDISLALVGHLVENPSPDTVIVLETMLKSSIVDLQRKGFNTNEALRKLAKEEDSGESELSQQEREKLIEEVQAEMGITAENPGDADAYTNGPSKKPGLFGRMFKTSKEPKPRKVKPAKSSAPIPKARRPVHFTERSKSNFDKLDKGLTVSKGFSRKHLNSNVGGHAVENDSPGQVCDTTEVVNIKMSDTRLNGGPNLFVVPQKGSGGSDKENLTMNSEWRKEGIRFRFVLRTLTQLVFENLKWDAVCIYLNENSTTIAFNSSGSLFFNLSYFVWNSVTSARLPGSKNFAGSGDDEWDVVRQLDFWYPVVAHEVAHNLVRNHGASHNHYMESYIQAYLPKLREVTRNIEDGKLQSPS